MALPSLKLHTIYTKQTDIKVFKNMTKEKNYINILCVHTTYERSSSSE